MQNEQDTASRESVAGVQPGDPAGAPAPRAGTMARRQDLPYKLPWLAGFLSGFFPGVGQLYVGYYGHGITLGLVFAGIITLIASGGAGGLVPLMGISLGFIWLFGIIDAARRAQIVNRHLDGYGQDPLPEGFSVLGGGSVFGGAVLAVLGLILLLHTRFGMDLQWLADWWPLAMIAGGVWLICKARRDRQR